jgi:hypothetical protein
LATTDKNFKIKNGLVVQGTTATVNGNDVLLDTTEDINYILSFVDVIDGGELSDES